MNVMDIIHQAHAYATFVQEIQPVAEVGFGDTLVDVTLCGQAERFLDREAGHERTYSDGDAFSAHALVRLHRGGMARFRLTHGLAAKFALTDCDGIDPEELHLPFSAFMIELPHPNGPMVGDFGEDADVNLLVVSRYRASALPFEAVSGSTFAEMMRGLLETKRTTDWSQTCLRMIAFSARSTAFLHSLMRLNEPVGLRDADVLPELTERDVRALIVGWRIVVNLVLYLKYTPAGEALKSGRTVNHDHGLQSIIYELGKDVKLDRDLRAGARAFCVSGKRPEGWTLAKRFIVRGHWKQQAHGPGRADRKMIFVEPYWKGPADAPALARAYTDEKGSSDG